jgi:hypothetical protein
MLLASGARRRWARAGVMTASVAGAIALAGCRSRVGELRDALVEDDAARASKVVATPPCADAGCLDGIARALGSKRGFDANDPDQASAAAVALLLVRDRRGDLAPEADRWIAAVTLAKGPGADALRLALARGMAELAPRVGTRWPGEDAALRALVHDVGAALPGSCETYARLGSGPADALPEKLRPERAPCVQRDLERKGGPGAAYGAGTRRAAAAIAALWREEAIALRSGLASADAATRPALAAKLGAIEAATAKMAPPVGPD